MTDLLVVGEGHGEVRASARLAAKVLAAHGSAHGSPFHTVREAMRLPVLGAGQLEQAAEIARRERPSALLVTSDLDDGCPSAVAPELSARLRSAGLAFPCAVVLFHREYETLFVAAAASLAGRTIHLGTGTLTLAEGVRAPEDPESPRDAKKWVKSNLFVRRPYKPTLHQTPVTAALTIAELRATRLSSFVRLESALQHLALQVRAGGRGVYPPRAPIGD